MRVTEGQPFPLGATFDGLGVNFALFSANATKVELCVFDPSGRQEIARVELPEYTDEVWHGYLPDARPGMVYGYRVHGPYDPRAGHRFNPNKLLVDPYALAHVGELLHDPAIFGYEWGHPDGALSFDERDSAPFVPKCRVIDPAFTWGADRRPRVPWEHTILYETHVRGYTIRHPSLPFGLGGTYAGLASDEVIAHIKELGVTSVELLPIHFFADEGHLAGTGLTNYWGYNTIGFFAPDARYASGASSHVSEFKSMVRRLHEAGLEVILDVVYNHTAEGNEMGPTISFKGIDNASYYRLIPGEEQYYINDTGTGNTLNLSHPRVLQMVTDSLRYWVTEMHVDGFRFDLATILGRESYGFDEGGGFLDSCRQDPVLAGVKLIAEPWDCGPGGYQVGGFPPGWAEWNDAFRDTVRAFWKSESSAAELSKRLCASADKFNRRGRRPWSSVNFITAHDGFTLNDVVSFNDKHNEANGENNRDGTSNNHSWNCGAEGDTDDAEVLALRERQMRNMMATLIMSQGTPMILAGDEFARTQNGNNNAYCQDNDISWVDWSRLEKNNSLFQFVRRLIALRRDYPILRRQRFMTGEVDPDLDVRDVTWVNAAGEQMGDSDWADGGLRSFGMLMDGRAKTSGIRREGKDATLLILFNGHHDTVEFLLPPCAGGEHWRLLLDTNRPTMTSGRAYKVGNVCDVIGRSMLLFALET
ncbi:glycogen debranching protein GlgX [Rhizosaccharibacter radicis]|uniref:Glycogen debranching protein GlgX n=1 Tax=Rhizosaccharibacter radicis TaxID=2782605 RepID=A0ABT1VXN1_9PROT|nr:glycogen debranching protein GlgX [Acetobacteraceae bacterium KSS12]